MADFFRNRLGHAFLGFVAAGCVGPAAAQPPAVPEGVDLAMDSFAYEGGTSRVNIRGLRLSQGDLNVEAEEATSSALDSGQSEWELRGDVRISLGTAQIESEQARFSIRNGELTTFELIGDPATFEDLDAPEGEAARGGANRLYLDNAARTLSLTEDAWLSVGASEVTGCDLIYDVDAGTFMSGSTQCDQPFRIRMSRPPEDTAANQSAPAP